MTTAFDSEEELLPDTSESSEGQVCDECGSGEHGDCLLLCDGQNGRCPAACHTFCDGLDAVPAADWLCRQCRPVVPEQPAVPAVRAAKQQATASATSSDVSSHLRVLEEKGLTEPVSQVPPGGQVFRHVEVMSGPATGWQIQGRLEVDRHENKETSRAPRWKYIHPDQRTMFVTLSAQTSWSKGVEISGIAPEAFAQLKEIQAALKATLSKRKYELADAGRLIDEQLEATWQEMLLQKKGAGATKEVLELRKKFEASVPRVPHDPEWRPSAGGAAAVATPVRKRELEAPLSQSGTTKVSRPLRRSRRDAFLSYMLRSLKAMPQGQRTQNPKPAERPKEQQQMPEAEAVTSSEEDVEEAVPCPSAQASEEVGNQGIGERRIEQRSTAMPLPHLVSDSKAAERELEQHLGKPVLSLLGLYVGDDLEGYEEIEAELHEHTHEKLRQHFQAEPALEDVAWRCLCAACVLGRIDLEKLPLACCDLLKASQYCTGLSSQFARIFVVREAMLVHMACKQNLTCFTCRIIVYFMLTGQADEDFAELRQFIASYKNDRNSAAAQVLKAGNGSNLAQLCAFALLYFKSVKDRELVQGSEVVACVEKLIQRRSVRVRCRGVAVFLGVFLAGCINTWPNLKSLIYDLPWPSDENAGLAKWELWLSLTLVFQRGANELSQRRVPLPSSWKSTVTSLDQGALLHALHVWQELVQAMGNMQDCPAALRLLAPGDSSPSVLAFGEPLLRGVWANKGASERLLNAWLQELHILRREATSESGRTEVQKLGEEWTRRAMLCFEAQKDLAWPGGGRAPDPGKLLPLTSHVAAESIALLLRFDPDLVTRKFACFFACPESHSTIAEPLKSDATACFRSTSCDDGPSFNTERPLQQYNGLRFAEIFENAAAILSVEDDGTASDCNKFMNWVVLKHIQGNRAKQGSPGEHTRPLVNPEVNRFARWVLDEVLDFRPPMLCVPSPSAAAKHVDVELEAMSIRAQVACQSFFKPLLDRVVAKSKPLWLLAACVYACLHASCICSVLGRTSGPLYDAGCQLLTAFSDPGSERVALADMALREAAKLPEKVLQWAFSLLARDVHLLLLWTQRLGSPATGFRADGLFRLAAVAAYHVKGHWWGPPGLIKWAQVLRSPRKLAFNPLKQSMLPGALPSMALTPSTLHWRPLAPVLLYLGKPDADRALGSFALLQQAIEVAPSQSPNCFGPEIDWLAPDLGAWSAALTGSDAADFVLLAPWRAATYVSLQREGQALALWQLQTAVSSRCAAVLCSVELGRASSHKPQVAHTEVHNSAGSNLQDLLQALLRDMAYGLKEALLVHHESADEMLKSRPRKRKARDAEEIAFWVMRHLLYRYLALAQIFTLAPERMLGGLGADVYSCLANLHTWLQRAGLAGEEEALTRSVAHGLAEATAALPWPRVEVPRASVPLVGEIAHAASAPDGCFTGGRWLPPVSTKSSCEEVLCAIFDAVENSPLGNLA
eukprot:TRINITY_DN32428_c0_g2_i1.p1 TRINITY_DN32428_c0_g2~~TRINITY_DN32428_c0_g2_i1.p1  ORF type:complete len:1471 (+),score=356.29 TRINITY_DN32428_c0_g2_i1:85-4497(+)